MAPFSPRPIGHFGGPAIGPPPRLPGWILIGLCVALTGCAALTPLPPDPDRRTLALVDRAVRRAGAGDAAYARVKGFPYLRVDRFLAAKIPPAPPLETGGEKENPPFAKGDVGGFSGAKPSPADSNTREARKTAWLRALRELDRAARAREIANLPEAAMEALRERLGIGAGRGALLSTTMNAGDRLLETEAASPGAFARIVQNARVPSEYSLALRTAGVYPATVWPVAFVTWRVNQRFMGWHQKPETAPALRGKRVAFGPADAERMSAAKRGRLFAPENRDPLGRPVLTEAEETSLFHHFAPVFAVDIAAPYDRPGQVIWNGPAAAVDARFPTIYTYRTHGFFQGETAVRLHYVIWFPARNGPVPAAYEHGHLDGLTVRVNLDPAGRPFMVDVMNNCGCYHFYVPDGERLAETISRPLRLDPFVPTTLPAGFPKRRLVLDVMSSWHQVYRISTAEEERYENRYEFRPYRVLESLPRPDGSRESLFRPDGIAKGTERIEPLLFFPMGVPDVGAMRQRGHHAIAFVGRDHFDDPHLFERHFQFSPVSPNRTPTVVTPSSEVSSQISPP